MKRLTIVGSYTTAILLLLLTTAAVYASNTSENVLSMNEGPLAGSSIEMTNPEVSLENSWDNLKPCTIDEGDYKIEVKGSFKQYLSYYLLADLIGIRRSKRVLWHVESGQSLYPGSIVIRHNDKGFFNNEKLSTHFGAYIHLGEREFLNAPFAKSKFMSFPHGGFTLSHSRATHFYPFCTPTNPGYYYLRLATDENLWLQRPKFSQTLRLAYLRNGTDDEPPHTAWKFHSQSFQLQ